MKRTKQYSSEFKERAVRLVSTGQQEHSSEWAAMLSVAAKLGCSPETLRRWVRKEQGRQGLPGGVVADESSRLKALEKEVRELRRANEILKTASAFFAQAEFERKLR